MTEPVLSALAVVLSYGLGSIPAGLLLGLYFRQVDLRQHGSGNIGATNTFRVLGKPLGIVTLLFDIGKGLAAVLCFARLSAWPLLPVLCGLAAILGHSFSIFLRFRGGKGVATSSGVFLALAPLPTLAATCAFLLIFAATRIVSLASIGGVVALVLAGFLIPTSTPLRFLILVIAALVLIKHRCNIARLRRKQEPRI